MVERRVCVAGEDGRQATQMTVILKQVDCSANMSLPFDGRRYSLLLSLSPSLSLWVATICGLTRTGQLGSRGALEGNPSTLSCENGEFQFQKQRNMSSLLHIHPPPLVIVDVVLTCMSMLAEVGGCIIKHTRALRLN